MGASVINVYIRLAMPANRLMVLPAGGPNYSG